MTTLRIELDLLDDAAIAKAHHVLGRMLGLVPGATQATQATAARLADLQPAATDPPAQSPADEPPVKRTRRTKAEIEVAKAAEKAVEPAPSPVAQATTAFDDPPVATSSFLDEEPAAEPAKVYTRDDARDALVGLQLKRHGQFKAKGQDEGTAARSAEVAAKAVLVAVGGSERLGGVDPSKWGALVEAANKAAAEGI